MNPDQNPYAPPRDFGMLPGAQAVPGGEPQGFRVLEVLETAWGVFKKHWPVLIAALVLAAVPGGLLNGIPAIAMALKLVEPNSLEYWGLYAGSNLVSMVVSYFFQVGFIRIVLDAVRGKTPDFMAILGGFDRFFPLLATNFLVVLALTFGLLFLVVPGVIVALGLGLAMFYCVDAQLGPIAALRASWQATRGHKVAILLFVLGGAAVYLVGFLACCIGVLPASIVVYLGWGIIYVRLSGHAAAPFSTAGA